MKLHNAIKETFTVFGIEYMLSIKLNYALLDYGAFEEFPSTRQIIRDVIVEGYTQLLYDMYKRDNRTKSFLTNMFSSSPSKVNDWKVKVPVYVIDFIKKTGYNDELVNYVFHSLLYGMGYLDNVTVPVINVPKTVPIFHTKVVKQAQLNTPPPFTPNVETQFLVVNFTPDIATLYIDGIEQKATYGKWADELVIGTHECKVTANGYIPKTANVVIESKKKSTININLDRCDSSISVVFEAETKDTEIWIDNVFKSKGKWSGLLNEGVHSVICRRIGCYDSIDNIHVDSKTKFPIVLPNLPHITGTLKVNVTPYGSKVWIDGKEMGETPMILKNVDAGVSHIKVVSPEGTIIEENISIATNDTVNYIKDIPTLYFTDNTKVKLGDYAYDDGTFSHTKTSDKTPIGFVCSLRTSLSDQQRGWTHGLIMSLKPAEIKTEYKDYWGKTQNRIDTQFAWGQSGVKLPDEMCVTDTELINHISKKDELDSGYDICIQQIVNKQELFPLFYAVNNCNNSTFPNSSGWYMPTIKQMIEIVRNLCNITNSDRLYWSSRSDGKEMELTGKQHELFKDAHVTCSVADDKHFWEIYALYGSNSLFSQPKEYQKSECIPILSF